MNFVSSVHKFHKTKRGYLVFALTELALAYLFASIAVDTASMWAYAATLIFSIGAILNFINLFAAPDRPVSSKGKNRNDGLGH